MVIVLVAVVVGIVLLVEVRLVLAFRRYFTFKGVVLQMALLI